MGVSMALYSASSLLLLIFLTLIQSYLASASTPTYPSCLEGNTSWDASLITSSTSGVASPEECQEICKGDSTCEGMTWTSANAVLFPLSCFTYSQTSGKTECTGCV